MRALLLCALAAAQAWAARPGQPHAFEHPEGRFKLSVPAAWTRARLGPDELGAGAWGAVFKSSPSARGEEEASITVVFYAAGNPHFKDAADYLARQTEPLPVTPVGEEAGPVSEARLGPLPAKALWRLRPVGRPPEAVRRKVRLRAELTVAQGEGGFFVMTCAAPEPRWRGAREAFEGARGSFAPLPAKRPKGP